MLRSTAENEEHILKMHLFGQDHFPSCPPKHIKKFVPKMIISHLAVIITFRSVKCNACIFVVLLRALAHYFLLPVIKLSSAVKSMLIAQYVSVASNKSRRKYDV